MKNELLRYFLPIDPHGRWSRELAARYTGSYLRRATLVSMLAMLGALYLTPLLWPVSWAFGLLMGAYVSEWWENARASASGKK